MWRDRRAWRPTYRRLTHKCCTSSPHHAKHTHPLSTELSQNTPTLSLHQIWIPSSSPPSNQFVVTARPRVSISKRDPKDQLLEPFLGLADSTSTLSLDLSFNRLLESRPCDLDQNDMIERAMRLGYVLLEAGKRSARKRATMHNAIVWALPPDLTTKVG